MKLRDSKFEYDNKNIKQGFQRNIDAKFLRRLLLDKAEVTVAIQQTILRFESTGICLKICNESNYFQAEMGILIYFLVWERNSSNK